jgi:23S rRNA (adenine2503-C2)-methyltransferase
MLEYLLFKGINDSEEDVLRLVAFCKGLNVRINLIAYNRTSADDQFEAVSRKEMFKFKTNLEKNGLTVTIRYSLGEDIAAACGQLACQDNE